ncbi:hypothetical protein BDP27DRAFT_1527947 [Rhodocollybia butyracea]|uniref:Uncharacterized protein n=1 Tax=Rhodocollybia butyracea TaxID=206335 RepID=A0A9P5U771_9AGAR|nr:hypothetical protein BDP27DRAFT_1527947 [Rhodocollybia butyracea]
MCAGDEGFLVIGCKDDFSSPGLKVSAENFAKRLEGYTISGVQVGVSTSSGTEKETGCSHQVQAEKTKSSSYVFLEHIARKFRVVVKNWPLDTLKSPSNLATSAEVHLLTDSWKSGTAHFYKMMTSKFEAWEANSAKAPLQQQHCQALLGLESQAPTGEETEAKKGQWSASKKRPTGVSNEAAGGSE